MPKRITFYESKIDEKRIFPLLNDFEMPISQLDLNKWWSKQTFKLEIHGKYGNCELCWKKSENNLIDNIRKGTRFIDWTLEMENKYDSLMFRGHKSITDLVKMAEQPFTQELQFDKTEDSCVCSF